MARIWDFSPWAEILNLRMTCSIRLSKNILGRRAIFKCNLHWAFHKLRRQVIRPPHIDPLVSTVFGRLGRFSIIAYPGFDIVVFR